MAFTIPLVGQTNIQVRDGKFDLCHGALLFKEDLDHHEVIQQLLIKADAVERTEGHERNDG